MIHKTTTVQHMQYCRVTILINSGDNKWNHMSLCYESSVVSIELLGQVNTDVGCTIK